MTLNDKKELYTILWKEARRLYAKYDLCGSKAGNTCIAYRKGFIHSPYCCNGCKYLSDKGCTVQSLACSLCICTIGRSFPHWKISHKKLIIFKRINKLRLIAKRYDIPIWGRDSKSDCFKHKN
jgi:hypothetical protein